jgi:hypothetical protein
MKDNLNRYIFLLLGIILMVSLVACTGKLVSVGTGPAVQWYKSFSREDQDYCLGRTVQQTTDGGYIICGDTGSESWLIKTDVDGNKLWDKEFGIIEGHARGYSAQQTTDGGYIIGGTRYFYKDLDEVIWLIKTDSEGNKTWDKTFASENDINNEKDLVLQTIDGGYIICGNTHSISRVTADATYTKDHNIWLIKTDEEGNKLWDKILIYEDIYMDARSIKQITDGGYVICADRSSRGYHGIGLIKTDADGNKLWDKAFDNPGLDRGQSVQQTIDGGYIICGSTTPSRQLLQREIENIWLIKTDADGNKLWDKAFDEGLANSVQQTTDGGYIVCGISTTTISDLGLPLPPFIWLAKTDADGNELWGKKLYKGWSGGYSVQQTADGGYIVLCNSSGVLVLLVKIAPEQ